MIKIFLSYGHASVKHINEKQRFKEWHLGFAKGGPNIPVLKDWENHAQTGFNSSLHYTSLSCFGQVM